MTKIASLFLGTALSVLGFAGPASAGLVTCEPIDGLEVADESDLLLIGSESSAANCRIRFGDPFTVGATGFPAGQGFGNLSVRLSGAGLGGSAGLDGQGGKGALGGQGGKGGSGGLVSWGNSGGLGGPSGGPSGGSGGGIHSSSFPDGFSSLSPAVGLSYIAPSGLESPKINTSSGINDSIQPLQNGTTAVPEPGAVALLGLGGVFAALSIRRRRRLPD